MAGDVVGLPDSCWTVTRLKRARDGDPEAWREFVEAYQPRLLIDARLECKQRHLPRDLADDLVAEVYERLLSHRRLFTFEYWGPGSFLAYLRGILGKVAADVQRRATTQKRLPITSSLSGDRRSGGSVPLEELVSSELTPTASARVRETLDRARQRLTVEERFIFEECAWKGKTSREVGRSLNLPAPTVRSRLQAIMRKLRTPTASGRSGKRR